MRGIPEMLLCGILMFMWSVGALRYPGGDYDLLRRNCCHFADDFARRLGVGGIPSWIMRLAKIGAGVEPWPSSGWPWPSSSWMLGL